jgi:anti-sigma regulatory factor (Ser/Thr protein kinase)/GAF domain-containing protein
MSKSLPLTDEHSVRWRVSRLIGITLLAMLAVGFLLAAQQYRIGRQNAFARAGVSAEATAQTVDQILRSRIETLVVLGTADEFRQVDRAAIKRLFDVTVNRSVLEPAALGWIDRSDRLSVSSARKLTDKLISVSDREYVREVRSTRVPFVSGAVTSRLNNTPVFVIAVPTFDDQKEPTGILTWAIRLDRLDSELRTTLGGQDTVVLDRHGVILFGPPESRLQKANARFISKPTEEGRSSVSVGATSPVGYQHQLVAQAGAPSGQWLIVRTTSVNEALHAARRTLLVELGILGATAASILAVGLWTQRSLVRIQVLQRETSVRSEALRVLATLLTPAASQADVTRVLTDQGAQSVGAVVSNVAAPDGYHPSPDHPDLAMRVSPTIAPEESNRWSVLRSDEHTPMRDAYDLGHPVFVASPKQRKAEYPNLIDSAHTANVVASASFPLFDSQENVVGVIGFGWTEDQDFDPDQLAMLDTAARIASQALERSALYDREQSARIGAEATQNFAADLATASSIQEVAGVIVLHASIIFGVHYVTFSAQDPTQQSLTLIASHGYDDGTHPSWCESDIDNVSPTTDCLHSQQMISVITSSPGQYAHHTHPLGDAPEGSWLCIPLPVEAFHPSVLVLAFHHQHSPTARHQQFPPARPKLATTEDFVTRAAIALDRERRLELTRRSAEQARLLAQVIGTLGSAETKSEVATAFVESLPSFMAIGGVIGTFDEHQRFEALLADFGTAGSPDSLALQSGRIQLASELVVNSVRGIANFESDGNARSAGSFRAAIPGEKATSILTTAKSFATLPLMAAGRSIGLAVFFFDDFQAFDDEQRVELTSYAALCANALARTDRFEREHEVAVVLQASLLPRVPQRIGTAELAGRYRPSAGNVSVGGDWFDAVELGSERFLLIVGDVVGHGIHSAAAMGKLSTAARALAPLFPQPAELLTQLDLFTKTEADARYASVAVVLVDLFGAKVSAAVAGHPTPILVTSTGDAEELQVGRGPALGACEFMRTQRDTMLQGSSLIILYTDGLTERRSIHVDDRVRRLMQTSRGSFGSVGELADGLLRAMLDEEQTDDVALMIASVEVNAPTFDRSFPGEMTSLRLIRKELRTWLQRVKTTTDEIEDLLLATGEVVTNAIEHGHRNDQRPVHITATREEHSCRVVVTDQGQWKSPSERIRNDARVRGRGMGLIHALMNDVQIERRPEGTVVTLTKTLNQQRGS